MKINIEIDCSPMEARKFMGLPDFEPLQMSLLKQIQAQLASALPKMSGDELVKSFVSLGQQGFQEFQNFFAKAAGAARGEARPRKRES